MLATVPEIYSTVMTRGNLGTAHDDADSPEAAHFPESASSGIFTGQLHSERNDSSTSSIQSEHDVDRPEGGYEMGAAVWDDLGHAHILEGSMLEVPESFGGYEEKGMAWEVEAGDTMDCESS